MNKVHFYRPMLNRQHATPNQPNRNFIPASNISKDVNGYILEIAVPGYTKEELDIHIEEENLKISGKFDKEVDAKDQYIHRSFSKQPFAINFKISDTIDTESISAKVENGLLTIRLALKAEAKKEIKSITIK